MKTYYNLGYWPILVVVLLETKVYHNGSHSFISDMELVIYQKGDEAN